MTTHCSHTKENHQMVKKTTKLKTSEILRCRPLPIGLFWFPSFLLYLVDEVDILLMLDSLNFFRTGWIPTRTKNIKKPWKLGKSNIYSKGIRYCITMWIEIIQTNSRKWHKFFGQQIRTLFVYCIDNVTSYMAINRS